MSSKLGRIPVDSPVAPFVFSATVFSTSYGQNATRSLLIDPLRFYLTSRRVAESALLASELANIGVALAEQVGAPRQVLHEPLVDLFGGDGDGLVLLRLEICGPGVKCADIVRLQMLLARHGVARLDGVLLDQRRQR